MSQIRKLPIYLILDTSGSMMGEPIEALRQGVRQLVSDATSDPFAVETVHLSVITFANTAQQVVPLTQIADFQEPQLNAAGPTALGSALDTLITCVDREVRKNTLEQKGDYKPLVFLMTDGQPTDDWLPAAARLKSRKIPLYACAAGPAADMNCLQQITDNPVIVLKDLQPQTIRAFFKWVTESVTTASARVESGGGEVGGVGDLPPPPADAGITIVP